MSFRDGHPSTENNSAKFLNKTAFFIFWHMHGPLSFVELPTPRSPWPSAEHSKVLTLEEMKQGGTEPRSGRHSNRNAPPSINSSRHLFYFPVRCKATLKQPAPVGCCAPETLQDFLMHWASRCTRESKWHSLIFKLIRSSNHTDEKQAADLNGRLAGLQNQVMGEKKILFCNAWKIYLWERRGFFSREGNTQRNSRKGQWILASELKQTAVLLA